MAWLFGAMTFIGIIASFFLPSYDDPAYYTETYGIEGLFDILVSSVRWMTAATSVPTIILVLIASRVEPQRHFAKTRGEAGI